MSRDLEAQARAFAAQTSELLNGTVADGIRISSITAPSGATVMGRGVTRATPDPQPIPLGMSGKKCVWLYLQHSFGWDPEQVYLTMTQSTLSLYSSEGMDDEHLVLGMDYIREPTNRYPGSHLHVHGDRDDLERIYLGDDRDSRKLRDLHLPVGGKRFRPTLEDMIEFVITEEMAVPRLGWDAVLADHRQRWFTIQLKAAVRREQNLAADALKEAGWSLTPPPG